ncbi:hypothetical protein A6A12_1280 [Vibrio anguillarum]|nr:hypothetical protein A6A12_1280 [Vibrio anguillarum]
MNELPLIVFVKIRLSEQHPFTDNVIYILIGRGYYHVIYKLTIPILLK